MGILGLDMFGTVMLVLLVFVVIVNLILYGKRYMDYKKSK